ncbi:MAG: phosphatase PAP2 family protein [Patescibacteria group bacterium]|nr:phosphatase PAP2 family protein [Patescibacteria group bacterium]
MIKIKNILRSIKIEEYILFIFSLVLISAYFILNGLKSGFTDFFDYGFKHLAIGVKYFSFVFLFIYLYIFYKLYLYIINWLNPLIEKKISFFSLSNPFKNTSSKIKKIFFTSLIIIKPLFSVSIFFGFITILLGLLAILLKGNFIDSLLMNMDNKLFGFYPFLGSYYQVDLFFKMIPLLIFGYLFLGSMMGITWVILYFSKKRELFSEYIVAMTLAVMIALPVWIIYPANSPRHLNNIYNPQRISQIYSKVDMDVKEIIANNKLDYRILNFHEDIGIGRNDVIPISTIPSMHVAWALLILYYLYKLDRRTIFFTLPWNFLSTVGAIYLGQHYFMDVIIAFPVVIITIWFANILVKMEKKYYYNNRFDEYEKKIKNQIRTDLAKFIDIFKYFYSTLRFRKK